MQSTSLYRSTKTRNVKSQDQLRSALLVHKQSSQSNLNVPPYFQTYNTLLPKHSIEVLNPILSAFTGLLINVNPSVREYYTIGIWIEDTSTVYRCCFIQPEVASMTCSFDLANKPVAQDILSEVRDTLPDAIPCTITSKQKVPQMSGRMVPYVTEYFDFKVSWGFANVSASYILFIRTDFNEGTRILTLSRDSMRILKSYFPWYGVCILDPRTDSHKITATPDSSSNMNEANKNTCIYVNNNGSFRLQGKPSAMPKVCSAFREAIYNVAESDTWCRFTDTFIPVTPEDQ